MHGTVYDARVARYTQGDIGRKDRRKAAGIDRIAFFELEMQGNLFQQGPVRRMAVPNQRTHGPFRSQAGAHADLRILEGKHVRVMPVNRIHDPHRTLVGNDGRPRIHPVFRSLVDNEIIVLPVAADFYDTGRQVRKGLALLQFPRPLLAREVRKRFLTGLQPDQEFMVFRRQAVVFFLERKITAHLLVGTPDVRHEMMRHPGYPKTLQRGALPEHDEPGPLQDQEKDQADHHGKDFSAAGHRISASGRDNSRYSSKPGRFRGPRRGGDRRPHRTECSLSP